MNKSHTAKSILENGAKFFEVTVEDITGDKRHQFISIKRMVIAATIRNIKGFSYPRIGKMFNRDHSTIMHSCRRVKADETLQRMMARFAVYLAGGRDILDVRSR